LTPEQFTKSTILRVGEIDVTFERQGSPFLDGYGLRDDPNVDPGDRTNQTTSSEE
jgi:hypothetical protein